MKLNNKGFAITGILYTLFILFLLILVSILDGLSSKRNMLEQSISKQENSFIGKLETNPVENNITTVSGKYKFTGNCIAYLPKGVNLKEDQITYIPSACNNGYEKTLETVYSFEEE